MSDRHASVGRSGPRQSASDDSRSGVLGALRFGASLFGRLHLVGICLLWGAAVGFLGVYVRGGWETEAIVWAVLLGVVVIVLGGPVVVTRYAAQAHGRLDGTFVDHLRAAGRDLPRLILLVGMLASMALVSGLVLLIPFTILPPSISAVHVLAVGMFIGAVPLVGATIPPLAIDGKGLITAFNRGTETLNRNRRTSVILVGMTTGIVLIVFTAWQLDGPLLSGVSATAGGGIGVWQAAITRVYLEESGEPRDHTPSEGAQEAIVHGDHKWDGGPPIDDGQ